MLIVCPSCAADYAIDHAMLGAGGRKVRCASCGHVWKALPQVEAPAMDAEAEPTPFDEVAPEGVTADGLVTSGEVLWGGNAIVDEIPTGPPAANALPIDDVWADRSTVPSLSEGFTEAAWRTIVNNRAAEARERKARLAAAVADIQRPAEPVAAKPRKKLFGGGTLRSAAGRGARQAARPIGRALAPVAVLAGLALVAAAVPYRDQVVRLVPDLAGLYALVGLEVNVRGLAFSSFTATREVVAGLPVMRIEGTLSNVSGTAREVGTLRIALMGEQGEELFAWTVEPDAESLAAGAVLPIASELTAPPPNASGVAVRFLRAGEELPRRSGQGMVARPG